MFIPPWFMGGNANELIDHCGWKMTPEDQGAGLWNVRSAEALHGSNPRLLTLNKLADSRNAHKDGPYSRLRRLRPFEDMHGRGWTVALDMHRRLAEDHSTEVSALLASISLLTTAAPSSEELEKVVGDSVGWLLPILPAASAHLVEVDPVLPHRYSVFQALLQANGIPPVSEDDGRAFSSAGGLLNETFVGFDSYLTCLLTSLAPDIWGISAGRIGGLLLYIFGTPVQGQKTHPLDPVQILSPFHGRTLQSPVCKVPPNAYGQAVKWWIERLNLLFSYITEPANYVESGRFSPQMAFEKVLRLELLFRNCQSIATCTRDQHARRIVMFNSLDTLAGLVPRSKWRETANSLKAGAILGRLEDSIPSEIARVLLPRARSAVSALRELEVGFFQKRLLAGGTLELPGKNGTTERVPLHSAATDWLRVIRNSQHGFDKVQTPRDRALLTAHDGHIPSAVADLAWLHLLDLMAFPEQLNRSPSRMNQS